MQNSQELEKEISVTGTVEDNTQDYIKAIKDLK